MGYEPLHVQRGARGRRSVRHHGGTQGKVRSRGAEPESLGEGNAGLLRGDLSAPDARRGGGRGDHGLGSPVTQVPLHLGYQDWCSVSYTPEVFVWDTRGSDCGMNIAFCKSDHVYISCIFISYLPSFRKNIM